MSLPNVIPNPENLIGVALVVNRNREGPRLVFHYPSTSHSHINPTRRQLDNGYGGYEDIDDGVLTTSSRPSEDYLPSGEQLARWNYEDHLWTDNGTQVAPWEYISGIPTKALEGILTPPRAFHRKRFQILLDTVYYVSYPIHVPTSGFWDKEKSRKIRLEKRNLGFSASEDAKRETHAPHDGQKEDKVSSMAMFNLVFMFNPKRHEVDELLDVMYTHVIREVNKVYKYCQESSDFVWQECKNILRLKDIARENMVKMSVLWEQILAVSSLAVSMRDVYEAVCRNKIAVLELKLNRGSVGHSVQIPMPFYVPDVQTANYEAAKSLWLTTATSFSRFNTLGGLSAFDKCTALLLAEDDDIVIAELQARRDKATAAMIELVRVAKPTLSFHQIAQLPETILTTQQVRAYAQHFIYWRRAMAVPPIHARDVYVLSPNCDLRELSRASVAFAYTFPFAPPLVDLLANLSTAPRPFKAFCPTKALRPAYLRILAWLIRGGWVCQICTFAYVVVWPEVQYEVEYKLEAEELEHIKKKQKQRRFECQTSSGKKRDRTGSGIQMVRPGFDVLDGQESYNAREDLFTEQSPSLPAKSAAGSSGPSAAERAAEKARQTRLVEKAVREFAERATVHARKPIPKSTEHPSMNDAPHLAGISPHIILDATKPSGRESLYLSTIEQHLCSRRTMPPLQSKKVRNPTIPFRKTTTPLGTALGGGASDAIVTWNKRVAETWPVYWKYFNGHSALEQIALLEDIKRNEAWNLLSAMGEYLLCVRHW